jgi:tRNA/tmRNA/rRNA uracil-C5-methylase (TrmA/RlmC/RlmD family)
LVASRELKIQDVAFGGKGVARENGKAVFVPFTIDGERISARIIHEKKNFAEAELIELIEPSKNRVMPECPYFGRCGGCSYQHIQYEHQLELKARQVEQTLQRIGRITAAPIQPIVPSPLSYGYRNRITVHSEDGIVGFYRRDEHRLIDVAKCPIAMPQVNDELAALRARRPRDGHYTLRVHSGPRIFSQTNDLVAHHLMESVAGSISEHGTLLIDAYCGAGFFAKQLLEKFDRIVGIDWDVHAIRAAMEKATAKEDYLAGNIDELLGEMLRDADPRSTTVIADPPATGLSVNVRRTLLEFPVATLIYVSCNPPTLARDLAELRERFEIVSVTPFDMFPQTAEIEVLVHLRALL